jgi:hypothetical protein
LQLPVDGGGGGGAGDCGGELVGTWQLSQHGELGVGITLENAPVERYTFNADQSYAFTAIGSDYVIDVPLDQLGVDGGLSAGNCDQLSSDAALFEGGCAADAIICSCTYAASGLAQSGQWDITNAHLELTEPNEGMVFSYCATAETLTLLTRFGNFVPTGVFTRR